MCRLIILSTIWVMVMPSLVFAQFDISGKVLDNNAAAVEFVNVVVSDNEDKMVGGDLTEEGGMFRFTLDKGRYVFKFSFLGFDDVKQTVNVDGNQVLEDIVLMESSNELTKVVVTAKRPTIIRKIDRLVFSIQNTTLSDSDAWEVLRKTPGVSASSNGSIQIHGKSGVIVMINERPVQLSSEELKSMLEGLSANDIGSVEVITNPPAKYGAEGVGIINIKMITKKEVGYSVSVRSKYTQSKYPKLSNGLTANYKGKQFDILAGYNFDNGKKQSLENSNIYFLDENNQSRTNWDEDVEVVSKYNTHNYRFSGNIYLSDKSTIGVQAIGAISPRRLTDNVTETVISNEENIFDSLFENKNDLSSNVSNTSYNLNFEQKLRKPEQKLNVDFDYTAYNEKEQQSVLTNFYDNNLIFLDEEKFESKSIQAINIYSGKFDFSTPLDSLSSMEIGGKFNRINTDSDLDYKNYLNGEYINDPARSNQFVYNESTYAAYVSYKRSFSKLTTMIGLRGEYTLTKGNSLTLNEITERNQFQLFPTVFLKYKVSEEHSLGLTYGRRISRPRFELLNPFKFYYGPFSYIEGNPFLKPSLTNNYSLTYTLKRQYFFKLFLYDAKDPITQLSVQDNENEAFKYIAVNLDRRLLGGFSFSTSPDVYSWWNIFIQANYYYQEDNFQVPENDLVQKNSKWNNYGLLVINSFDLSGKLGLSMELESAYLSSRIQGGFNLDPLSEVSVGIKKKFLNKNGSISLYVSDIFNQNVSKMKSEYGNQNHTYSEKAENQKVRLAVSYKFGNQKLRLRSKKTSTEKEKERL